MNFALASILSLSVGITAVIGLARFRKIEPDFYPFVVLIWLGLLNEVISISLVYAGVPNAANSNIFIVLESMLLMWQFYQWQLFEKRPFMFCVITLILLLFWIVFTFFFSTIHVFNSYFIIFRAFIITLASIAMINKLITTERDVLLKNSIFIICMGMILFYTFSALVEIFWIYGLDKSYLFRTHIYEIVCYINVLSNLIYALAILWMPKKHQFTLLF